MQPQETRRDFVFQQVFNPESTQQEVFETTAMPLAMHVLNGYNGTYFVYGQTGTGKTHSMGVLAQLDQTSKGIVPNSLEFIFNALYEMRSQQLIVDWQVNISFFQIYMEHVSDLLNPGGNHNMNIREEGGEIFVEDLSECQVGSLDQAMKLVNAGLMHREMGSHQMNETSSRSHTILHIDVYQTRRTEQTNRVEHIHGRLVLADLAGSERVRKTTSTGVRLEEAKHINASLSALGNVISSLANPRKNGQ